MTFGSVFSGIGGLDIALDRAGWEPRWQIEIADYPHRVLGKRWPDVRRYRDILEVSASELERVDLIVGGFPCQDISNAGHRAGITGNRSGLWVHMYRLIRFLRPRYVLIENVAALLGRGADTVPSDLAAGGYDAVWQIVSAASVGAPHIRERVFVVAWHVDDTAGGPCGMLDNVAHAAGAQRDTGAKESGAL